MVCYHETSFQCAKTQKFAFQKIWGIVDGAASAGMQKICEFDFFGMFSNFEIAGKLFIC